MFFVIWSCKNINNFELVNSNKEMGITIELPNIGRSVKYYSKNDVFIYKITLCKNEKNLDTEEGKPGESITIEITDEGDYLVKLQAYNGEEKCIAEGQEIVSVNQDNLSPKLKIQIYPNVKSIRRDKITTVPQNWKYVHFTDSIDEFLIDNDELSYSRWYEVYQWAVKQGYVFRNFGREDRDGVDGAVPKDSNKPVSNICWRDAIVWCNAASMKDGLEPYYYIEGTTDFSDKSRIVKIAENTDYDGTCSDNPYKVNRCMGQADKCVLNYKANGYRIPTEEEWALAASNYNLNNASSSQCEWSMNIISTNRIACGGGWKLPNNQQNISNRLGVDSYYQCDYIGIRLVRSII